MPLNLLLALLFDVVLLLSCLYALIRGGRPERIGAVINLAASAVTTALRLFDIRYFAPAEALVFAIDVAVVAGFYWLAVRTTRFWPVWAFGFALADVFINISGVLLPRTPLFAFHSGLGLYAYLALGAMTLGTYRLGRDASADERRGIRRGCAPDPPDAMS
ncbi:hypothetical protein EAH79_02150 [Sphingomonas koreensis]|nr:hypothetical protein EAH79_02150 [Sphingomonas koreensis]